MSLEQDKSFYCVVDGMVQVFAHTGQPDQGQQGLWDHEDMNGYQLLNEVGSGGTLSSLFTILSLFTEDVKMSWQNDHDESSNAAEAFSVPRKPQRDNADVSRFDLGQDVRTRRSSISSTASTVHPFQDGIPNHPEYTRPMSPIPDDDDETTASLPRSHNSHTRHTRIHEGVVARASEDSTLAVIPAEAFRRLTKKYPKATGHIVQGGSRLVCLRDYLTDTDTLVILTRFSRVTFNAAHRYLGLTSEVLRTEKAINDIACHPLPSSFYEGGGLQYLRQRFDGTSTTDNDNDYLNASESSNTLSGKTLSESPRSSKVQLNDPPRATRLASSTSQTFKAHGRNSVQAGDLLSSTTHAGDFYRPISGSISTPRVPGGVKPLESRRIANLSGDEFDLREEVMSCIAKSIGLLQPPLSGTESVEASPAISPSDGRRSSGLFTPSFSSLSLLDIGDDASSVTGGASSSQSIDGYMSGLDNEVEMLFFAAGTTLVKAGEVNTGIYVSFMFRYTYSRCYRVVLRY